MATDSKSLFDVAMELRATDVPNVRRRPGGWPTGPLGQGVSICFMCADAIAVYHDSRAQGLKPSRPFVGNNLWVTSLIDPDGYRLDFESPTDVPEETVYSDPT